MVKSPSKSSKSSKHSVKHKPYAVFQGKELKKHAKPYECRQQLEDAFDKKICTLPVGEVGLLVILPADKRGPVRIKTHNLTRRQAAATIEALSRSLPDPHAKKRLTDWASQARSRRGQKSRKRRLNKGEFLLLDHLG
jgi:hypothetical protein